jgi:hypothetical protein
MIRTPTTFVTANAFAARAFAWGILGDAHGSGRMPETASLSPQLH